MKAGRRMVRISNHLLNGAVLWAGLALVLFTLVACSSEGEILAMTLPAPTVSAALFSPKAGTSVSQTAVSTPIQNPTRTSENIPVKPSPTPDCSDGLEFVSDLTVPDGTMIARGAAVDKRWQVKNIGTCNWDERYKLVLVQGPELGLPVEQALFPARAGKEGLIRMLLIAPIGPGVYTSAWQAFNPKGEPFGDVIYIKFQVN